MCRRGGGILPGVIGCIQANECIKIILGVGQTLSGRMLVYDALNMTFREFKLQRDPLAEPITELVNYTQFCGVLSHDSKPESFFRISVREIHKKRIEGWNPFVLDVRSAAEEKIVSLDFVDLCHPHRSIADVISSIPKDRDILVHCKFGGRSAHVCAVLAEHGYTALYNMDGGIVAWVKEIDPSLPIY